MLRKANPSERVRAILPALERMTALAQLAQKHVEARQRILPEQRHAADAALMETMAGKQQLFWELLERILVYARDSMKLAVKVTRDADASRLQRTRDSFAP